MQLLVFRHLPSPSSTILIFYHHLLASSSVIIWEHTHMNAAQARLDVAGGWLSHGWDGHGGLGRGLVAWGGGGGGGLGVCFVRTVSCSCTTFPKAN